MIDANLTAAGAFGRAPPPKEPTMHDPSLGMIVAGLVLGGLGLLWFALPKPPTDDD